MNRSEANRDNDNHRQASTGQLIIIFIIVCAIFSGLVSGIVDLNRVMNNHVEQMNRIIKKVDSLNNDLLELNEQLKELNVK